MKRVLCLTALLVATGAGARSPKSGVSAGIGVGCDVARDGVLSLSAEAWRRPRGYRQPVGWGLGLFARLDGDLGGPELFSWRAARHWPEEGYVRRSMMYGAYGITSCQVVPEVNLRGLLGLGVREVLWDDWRDTLYPYPPSPEISARVLYGAGVELGGVVAASYDSVRGAVLVVAGRF